MELLAKDFMRMFTTDYPHISHELTESQVADFLAMDVIQRVSLAKKMDYFADYLMANDLAEVML
jgi:hypothetical protein